ncbi:MAG: hypothetical protein CMJ78_05390 [Planctomycetaceae bacterium]|nr:hypothetical protein [Planctomycetaceae bacterium]
MNLAVSIHPFLQAAPSKSQSFRKKFLIRFHLQNRSTRDKTSTLPLLAAQATQPLQSLQLVIRPSSRLDKAQTRRVCA